MAAAIILMKDGELNKRNYLAIAKTILQREKSIYFLPILTLGEKKRPNVVLYLCGYARI